MGPPRANVRSFAESDQRFPKVDRSFVKIDRTATKKR